MKRIEMNLEISFQEHYDYETRSTATFQSVFPRPDKLSQLPTLCDTMVDIEKLSSTLISELESLIIAAALKNKEKEK